MGDSSQTCIKKKKFCFWLMIAVRRALFAVLYIQQRGRQTDAMLDLLHVTQMAERTPD